MLALESLPCIDLATTSESIFSRTLRHNTINEPATNTQSQVVRTYEHMFRVGVRVIYVSNDMHVCIIYGYITIYIVEYNRALAHILVYLTNERYLYISIGMA
jgi:hypothetical protein